MLEWLHTHHKRKHCHEISSSPLASSGSLFRSQSDCESYSAEIVPVRGKPTDHQPPWARRSEHLCGEQAIPQSDGALSDSGPLHLSPALLAGHTDGISGSPAARWIFNRNQCEKNLEVVGGTLLSLRGTPTGVWLDYEFSIVFGVKKRFAGATALEIYDEINEKLQLPKFRPRALFERFKIAVLSTTDAATDTLEAHQKIKASGWKGNIIPCFRPDGVTDLKARNWKSNIELLSERSGIDVTSYGRFIQALENRRAFFKSMHAVSTDHGVSSPYTHEFTKGEGERIFQRALMGQATSEDAAHSRPTC